MKKFILGILIGLLVGSAVSIPLAWAAARAVLVNGSGVEIGTASNPLYVTT